MQASDSLTLAAGYIPGLGFEPKVTGYAFCNAFQMNAVSPGIKGQGGVYFISVTRRTPSQIDANIMNMIMPQQRRQQEGQLRNSVSQLLQQTLIKKADVKYNVDNF